ncbi:adenylate cyclase type 8-like [Crassostrea virginica]
MAKPTARVYPAGPSDREMTIDRNIMTDPNIMEKEKEWRILYARFPWKHYQTQSIEQKYHVFRKQKMLYISKHLPLSSVCFGGIVFALNVLHFKEERVTAILSTCIFLLVNVAVFSLYCAKEIQTNTSHIVAQFVVVLPFFLLVCVQLLDFRDISASGTRLEWVTFLVFLAFVTLPVRYWVCCAWVFVLFLGQMSTVVFKLLRNGRSHTDILYQVSLSTSIFFCACAFGSYMYHRQDSYLRNAFYVVKDSFLTNIAIERTRNLQKNLLSAILPKGIVTKISRDFSLYTSNTFRELCSKCHDDVSMLFCSVEGLGDLADKSPQSCIALINEIMSQFTYLAKKHFLEEVGWSVNEYQAVCGAVETRADHPILTVYMAMTMMEYMKELKHKVKLPHVHLRIAVHTGDVVTEVLGTRHWRYDLLGDDVIKTKELLKDAHNGQVLISEATRSLLHDEFIIECINESSFSVKYVVKRFSACDYEKGIAARRIHRKFLEEDVQKLRDKNLKIRELKRKRSSVQAFYMSSIKPACDRERETISRVYIGLAVLFVLINFYITAVISHVSLVQIIAAVVTALFLFSFLAINFLLSKVKGQHRTVWTQVAGHLFVFGYVSYFCASTLILMVENKTMSTPHNDSISSPLPLASPCCFPSFIAVSLTALLVTLTACDVVGLVTKLCCVAFITAFYFLVKFNIFLEHRQGFAEFSPSLMTNYYTPVNFAGICVCLILLNIQVSYMFSGLVALTVRNKRKNKQLIDCKQKYRMLVLELFPYELATTFLHHISNHKTMFDGSINTVGIAVISVTYDEERDDIDNETSNIVNKFTNLFEKIDKLLQDVAFSEVRRLVSSVTSHIFISGSCYGLQGNHATEDNKHLNQMTKFLLQVQILCLESSIKMKAGVHFGPVLSSMVGGSSARWGMWGTSLDIAKHIQTGSAPNSIRVSQDARCILEKFGHTFGYQQSVTFEDLSVGVSTLCDP